MRQDPSPRRKLAKQEQKAQDIIADIVGIFQRFRQHNQRRQK